MIFFQPANHVSKVFQEENIEEQVQDLKTFLVGHVWHSLVCFVDPFLGQMDLALHLARKNRPFSLSNSMWSILAPTPSLPRTCTTKDMMGINWIHIKSYHIIIILLYSIYVCLSSCCDWNHFSRSNKNHLLWGWPLPEGPGFINPRLTSLPH